MGRPKKDAIRFPLTAAGYRNLVRASILKPLYFGQTVSERRNVREAGLFFLMNVSLGTLLKVALVLALTQNLPAAFIAISSLIYVLPASLAIFVALVFGLFLLAKVMGGKGSFVGTFCASSYCLVFLFLFQLPILSIPALGYSLALLVIGFRSSHNYGIEKAVLTIMLHFSLFLVICFGLGLANPIYLLSLNII